jgi:hypothetical protein
MWRGDDSERSARVRRAARAQSLAQANQTLSAIAWLLAGLLGAYLLSESPRLHRQFERAMGEEIERENTAFCEKVGLTRQTPAFRSCVLDLREIRANQERRRNEEAVFF